MSDEIRKFLQLVKQFREAELQAERSKSRADVTRAQNLGRLVDTRLKTILEKNESEVKALELFSG
jgi:hypothetical protein